MIPGSGRSLEKEMATHSSILIWEVPWTQGNKPSPQVRTQARCQTELWASHGARGRGPGSPEKTVSSGNRKHRITSYILFSVVNWKVFMEAIPHYFQKFPLNTHLLKIFYFPDTVSDALRTVCGQDQDFYPCGQYITA